MSLVEIDRPRHDAAHVLPAEVRVVAFIQSIRALIQKKLEIRAFCVEDLAAAGDKLRLRRLPEAIAEPDVRVTALEPREFPRHTANLSIHSERQPPCNAASTGVQKSTVI